MCSARAPKRVIAGVRPHASRVRCRAMGIGFLEDEPAQSESNPLPESIGVPSSMFGLNPRQMLAMGIAGDDVQRLQTNLTEVRYYIPSKFCFSIVDASLHAHVALQIF
jgi:hypothetical protein